MLIAQATKIDLKGDIQWGKERRKKEGITVGVATLISQMKDLVVKVTLFICVKYVREMVLIRRRIITDDNKKHR